MSLPTAVCLSIQLRGLAVFLLVIGRFVLKLKPRLAIGRAVTLWLMWTSLANGPARSRGELESFDICSLTILGKSLDLPIRKSLSSNNLSGLAVMCRL